MNLCEPFSCTAAYAREETYTEEGFIGFTPQGGLKVQKGLGGPPGGRSRLHAQVIRIGGVEMRNRYGLQAFCPKQPPAKGGRTGALRPLYEVE